MTNPQKKQPDSVSEDLFRTPKRCFAPCSRRLPPAARGNLDTRGHAAFTQPTGGALPAQKYRDNNYLEGWAGDFADETTGALGLKVSNQATDTYKVKPPFGTWCRGLGGNSVKCETEHYTVMEHVLSCHEAIPYLYADPVSGAQEVQSFDDLIPPDYPNEPPYELPRESTFDCTFAGLDDDQFVVEAGIVTETLLTSNHSVANGGQMDSNDLTTVLDNYSVSPDYTITLKDDGKPDYHWGTLIKRPNDIRMYARFDVPPEWTAPDAPATGYLVTRALLYVTHWITNNPNDQLRPEDIENEAATGRKPSYRIDDADSASPVWKSTVSCYESDADVIDTEEGGQDPTFIGIGTYLKNTPYALPVELDTRYGSCEPDAECYPQPISSDLTDGNGAPRRMADYGAVTNPGQGGARLRRHEVERECGYSRASGACSSSGPCWAATL